MVFVGFNEELNEKTPLERNVLMRPGRSLGDQMVNDWEGGGFRDGGGDGGREIGGE